MGNCEIKAYSAVIRPSVPFRVSQRSMYGITWGLKYNPHTRLQDIPHATLIKVRSRYFPAKYLPHYYDVLKRSSCGDDDYAALAILPMPQWWWTGISLSDTPPHLPLPLNLTIPQCMTPMYRSSPNCSLDGEGIGMGINVKAVAML